MATKRLCCIPNCGKPHKAHGYCNSHSHKFKRYGHADVPNRYCARPAECAVRKCAKTPIAKGFCSTHYQRFIKHGDPFGGSTFRGRPLEFLLDASYSESEDCIIWPFNRDQSGYARVRVNGKLTGGHIFVCEKVNGPKPPNKDQAAHSCGNGHLGCITPKHLRWATTRENSADRVVHGTDNRGIKNHHAVLSDDDVISIRSAKDVPIKELASRYGVTSRNIYSIRRGDSWSWLNPKRRPD